MGWPGPIPKEKPNQLFPYLSAETPAGHHALSGEEILVSVLPFRVGRESRHLSSIVSTYLTPKERRDPGRIPNNDLYIVEEGECRFLSREHFLIHQEPDGRYFVLDRGSTLGTVVGKRLIGGDGRGGKAYLKSGDRIIPGGTKSPFVFRFQLRAEKKTASIPAAAPAPSNVERFPLRAVGSPKSDG